MNQSTTFDLCSMNPSDYERLVSAATLLLEFLCSSETDDEECAEERIQETSGQSDDA